MKKIVGLAIAAALAIAVSACGNSNGDRITAAEHNWRVMQIENLEAELGISRDGGGSPGSNAAPYEQAYIKNSVFLTDQMIKVAENDDYLQIIGVPAELWADIKQHDGIDSSMLKRAVVLNYSAAAIDTVLDEMADYAYLLTSSSRALARGRVLQAFASQINSSYAGYTHLAAMTILQQTEAFLAPADLVGDGYTLVVLLYDVSARDNKWTAICFVSFRNAQEGTTIGTACFVDDFSGELSVAFYDDARSIPDRLRLVGAMTVPEQGLDCSVYEGSRLEAILSPGAK